MFEVITINVLVFSYIGYNLLPIEGFFFCFYVSGGGYLLFLQLYFEGAHAQRMSIVFLDGGRSGGYFRSGLGQLNDLPDAAIARQ